MRNEMNARIREWLCGPRDHAGGVELYRLYGANLMLRRQFALDDSAAVHEILVEELRKLAGIGMQEFLRLPRRARAVPRQDPETAAVVRADVETPAPGREEIPETARKMIAFRDRYPFLREEGCPDVLKVMVADMFAAYDRYRTAFSRLQALGDADSATALGDCAAVVEGYLANQEMWAELDHYRDTGRILGKAPLFRRMEEEKELSALDDMELMRKHRSAVANLSKHRRRLAEAGASGAGTEDEAGAVRTWEARRDALAAEIDRRKKK